MIEDCTGSVRREVLALGDCGNALDVGCGDGRKTRVLAECAGQVAGVDPDRNLVGRARERCGNGRAVFLAAGAEALCFPDGIFDAVLFSESLHHVPLALQGTALAEAHRVMTDAGTLLIMEPVHGSGSFGRILQPFKDEKEEKEEKEGAIRAIQAAIGDRFTLCARREICVTYRCQGVGDLLACMDRTKGGDMSGAVEQREIEAGLQRCRRHGDGSFRLDYQETVWQLGKKTWR